MSDISFESSGTAIFPTKWHGEVALSKGKWDRICDQPERAYYRLNGEKIATTLMVPDHVRKHSREPHQFLYYKKFQTCRITEAVEAEVPFPYWTVIINAGTKKICTIYPVDQPKIGKEYRGG